MCVYVYVYIIYICKFAFIHIGTCRVDMISEMWWRSWSKSFRRTKMQVVQTDPDLITAVRITGIVIIIVIGLYLGRLEGEKRTL